MIPLIAGLLIGATAGVFIACLLVAAKRGDDQHEHDEHRCNGCSAVFVRGSLMVGDELTRARFEGIERIVRAGFPRQDGGR